MPPDEQVMCAPQEAMRSSTQKHSHSCPLHHPPQRIVSSRSTAVSNLCHRHWPQAHLRFFFRFDGGFLMVMKAFTYILAVSFFAWCWNVETPQLLCGNVKVTLHDIWEGALICSWFSLMSCIPAAGNAACHINSVYAPMSTGGQLLHERNGFKAWNL